MEICAYCGWAIDGWQGYAGNLCADCYGARISTIKQTIKQAINLVKGNK